MPHPSEGETSAGPTTSEGSSDGRGPVRVRQLVVVYAPLGGPAPLLTLGDASVVVGREPEGASVFSLEDSEASRSHATVTYDAAADTFWIEDKNSRNGTLVDGKRVARAHLAQGTVVRIGRTLLVMSDTVLRGDDRLEPETARLRGTSLAMQKLRGEIAMVAAQPISVLILGETGTGKERAAEELHRLSGRTGEWVPVNCAAIPENLAESELFGHAAGAFTGAVHKSEGVFVAADKGTLFLDEIGELPPAVQPKLLRALSAGEVRSIGKASAILVDVRVVAATHRDISPETGAASSFRADLFARVAGWTLRVPPLRERRDDILRLTRGVLERLEHTGKLSPSAAHALLLYDWPRNVRELEQVLTVAVVRAGKSETLRSEHLPTELTSRLPPHPPSPQTASAPPIEALVPRDQVPTADGLQRVLQHFQGNVARVAEFFGKDRNQIYRWTERHGIEPRDYKDRH